MFGVLPLCFFSDGFHYFVIFVDVHIKHIWYYPFVAKSDFFPLFNVFKHLLSVSFPLKLNLFKLIGAVNIVN